MVHLNYERRPVAEGIVGSTPPPRKTKGGTCQSLLAELCDDGQQMVRVTKLHQKNTELMIPDANANALYLNDNVSPPHPCLGAHL